jgi:hypothetical protein
MTHLFLTQGEEKLQHPCTDLDHESLNKFVLQHPCTEKGIAQIIGSKKTNKREAATEDVLKRTCPDLRLKENN